MENTSFKKTLGICCLVFIAACGGSDDGENNNNPAVLASYPAPTADPAGLTFDGTLLWMSGDDEPGTAYQPMLYKINPASGTLIEKITPPSQISYAGGLAWTGSYLAVLDGLEIHYLDSFGNHVSSFTAPALWSDNLAYDGANFWGSDGFDTVYQFDNGGNSLGSFSLPASGSANGLAWDGSHLWVGGAFNSTINRVDSLGNLQASIDIGLDFPWLQDLAFDGSYLWISEDLDDTLYQLIIN